MGDLLNTTCQYFTYSQSWPDEFLESECLPNNFGLKFYILISNSCTHTHTVQWRLFYVNLVVSKIKSPVYARYDYHFYAVVSSYDDKSLDDYLEAGTLRTLRKGKRLRRSQPQTSTSVHFKKKAVNLLARLHGNVCLVLTKSKVLNDKKMNWKVENMNLVGITFLEFTVRFWVFGHLTWVAK